MIRPMEIVRIAIMRFDGVAQLDLLHLPIVSPKAYPYEIYVYHSCTGEPLKAEFYTIGKSHKNLIYNEIEGEVDHESTWKI